MASFASTLSPTPFGFFDADSAFQTEADAMVNFVKRKLGDDILSVELTKKQIWSCFEEATCEYTRLILETKIQSDLTTMMGLPTGSASVTNRYPQRSLEYLLRMAEPYANNSFVGGSSNPIFGYIDIVGGLRQLARWV
jgi:hypothetical protein